MNKAIAILSLAILSMPGAMSLSVPSANNFQPLAVAPEFGSISPQPGFLGNNVLSPDNSLPPAPPGIPPVSFTSPPNPQPTLISANNNTVSPAPTFDVSTIYNNPPISTPGVGSSNAPIIEDRNKAPNLSTSARVTAKVPVTRGKATIRVRLQSSTLPGASPQPIRGPLTTDEQSNPRYCSSCVQKEVNTRMNNLLQMIENTKSKYAANFTQGRKPVYSVRTESVTLAPEYVYETNTRILDGYLASNSINVEADSNIISIIVDEAIKNGATEVNNVQMTPSDEDINAAKEALEEQAVKRALHKARKLLSAAGLDKKAPVISIEVNSNEEQRNYPPIAFASMARMDFAGGESSNSSTPITAEDSEVSANATVTVSLKGEGGYSLVI